MNVSDLRKVLGMADLPSDDESTDNNDVTNQSQTKNASAAQSNNTTRDSGSRQIRVRRQSMEQLDLIKVFLSFDFCLFTLLLCQHTFFWLFICLSWSVFQLISTQKVFVIPLSSKIFFCLIEKKFYSIQNY